ncbi:hypothetical protein [Lichenifustis flavocetrariae]|uniref:Uncharacterized protein n=1 Tax=Lichenifustis flavocetrariae TaxID=2949735 RepID=A0AA42CQ04_9HYPH|nr:hypothetical protein [Lichenifustis flavocetrariae]MCW6510952.1 hypothetical protein [Lichenifustis flavocetrariae]
MTIVPNETKGESRDFACFRLSSSLCAPYLVIALLAARLITTSTVAVSKDCLQDFVVASFQFCLNPKLAGGSDLLCFTGFATLFSGLTRTSIDSAELLTADRIGTVSAMVRVNRFDAKAHVLDELQSELKDYRVSGSDRGHDLLRVFMPTAPVLMLAFTALRLCSLKQSARNRNNFRPVTRRPEPRARWGHQNLIRTDLTHHSRSELQLLPALDLASWLPNKRGSYRHAASWRRTPIQLLRRAASPRAHCRTVPPWQRARRSSENAVDCQSPATLQLGQRARINCIAPRSPRPDGFRSQHCKGCGEPL